MIRRLILLLVLCCICQPAVAVVTQKTPWPFFEEDQPEVLQPEYRKCLVDEDCTYGITGCSFYYAVSKSSQKAISEKISDAKVQIECEKTIDPGPVPDVHCVKGLCEIVPYSAK